MMKSHSIIKLDTWVRIIGNFILQSRIKLKFKIHYVLDKEQDESISLSVI